VYQPAPVLALSNRGGIAAVIDSAFAGNYLRAGLKIMLISYARRVAAAAGIACAALLVADCNAQGDPSTVVTSGPNPPVTSSASTAVTARTTARVLLAEGQDLRGRLLYRPACTSGCPLSGDSTAILSKMTWRTWAASQAVGTGTYELDGCNPDCAAGPIYKLPTVVTLSRR
jgi:hypothetical protein